MHNVFPVFGAHPDRYRYAGSVVTAQTRPAQIHPAPYANASHFDHATTRSSLVTSTPPAPPRTGLGTALWRRKPVADRVAEAGHGPLKRTLGLGQLTTLSIGATLGSGIFVVLGEAVPVAGPAVVVSFVLAGITALFSALSYAELAGMIPLSGSSYSYAYATLGELVAWVCGWFLVLEYSVSVTSVAVGWGQYVNELLQLAFELTLPDSLSAPPGDGGLVDVPAIVVVLLAMVLLLGGAKESARANAVLVAVKIATLVLFCPIAFSAVRAENYTPFHRSASPA